jgi:hypothetical protein
MSGYEIITEALPPGGSRGSGKYPWHDLDVGVCFVIPAKELVGKSANYSPNVPPNLKVKGYKISTRKQPNGDMKVYRVA